MKRPRFSLKLFLIAISGVAIVLATIVGRAHHRKRQIEAYRDQGTIAYFVRKPPPWLTSLGITHPDPFFLWARVELYATLADGGVRLGDDPTLMPMDRAKATTLQRVRELRSLGVDFIDLAIVGEPWRPSFEELMRFGLKHTDSTVGEDGNRYRLRLAANRATGANTNPAYTATTAAPPLFAP